VEEKRRRRWWRWGRTRDGRVVLECQPLLVLVPLVVGAMHV
jgi:hypothetical protein